MKKQQLLVAGFGFVVLISLYFFGRTTPSTKVAPEAAQAEEGNAVLDFPTMLRIAKQKLTPEQNQYVNGLENSISRGDLKTQQLQVYRQLAIFWRDTAQIFVPYAKYSAEAAKLENSEKSLTFAANLLFDDLQNVSEAPLKSWEANEAKDLYERVLTLNPTNDSAKVSLGGCYIFGSPSGSPQQTMQGIQKILEVSRRDSSNMYAQYVLGLGGMVSGQTERAIVRFQVVVNHQPNNLNAILRLAEAYEKSGDKENAKKIFIQFKNTVLKLDKAGKFKSNATMLKSIDEHVKSL